MGVDGALNIAYSSVEGSEGEIYEGSGSDLEYSTPGGNIVDEPDFTDAGEGDFHLLAGSAGINVGDPDADQESNAVRIPKDIFDINDDSDFDEPTPDRDLQRGCNVRSGNSFGTT